MWRGLYAGLLVALLPLCAQAQDDPLSLHFSLHTEDEPLEAVLTRLVQQKGVRLSFSPNILPARRVTVDLKNSSLKRVLDSLLKGSGLAYERIGAQVVLFRARPEKYTLSGYVVDARSGERLISATVHDERSGKGAVTNAYGFFSLTLPAGRLKLVIRYLGYKTQGREVLLDRARHLQFALQPALVLDEIEVIATPAPGLARALPADELKEGLWQQLPRLGGERDVLRTAYFMPGVQTGADGIGGLHVRGGDRGQNLILLDGVPVYDVAHAGGLISLFTDEIVKKATLIKGAFPARYGGRLSSVLDIRTREGSLKAWEGMASLSMLTSQLALGGPLVKDKVSIFASARWSHLGMYLRPYSRSKKREEGRIGALDYDFFDLHLKLNYLISKKHRIYLSLYRGRDRFSNTHEKRDTLLAGHDPDQKELLFGQTLQEGNEWGNTLGVFRWNFLVSPRLFSNFSLTYSRLDVLSDYFRTEQLTELEDSQVLDAFGEFRLSRSLVEDFGLKTDWDWVASPAHRIRFGGGATHHTFDPGLQWGVANNGTQPEPGDNRAQDLQATEWWMYAEDAFQLGSRWSFNVGLRYAGWQIRSEAFHVLEPRLAASYQVAKTLQVRASLSRMSQFVHLLSNSEVGLPTDLWVPATANTGVQASWQTTLGLDLKTDGGWMGQAEAYYKHLQPLLALSEGARVRTNWEENITRGSGRAWGAELGLGRRAGAFEGWVSYGLSYTNRTYERINFGRPYPLRYDRRHDIKAAFTYAPKDWLTLSCSWMMNSGLAFNLPTQQFTVDYPGLPDPDPILIFGDKNEFRMPWYHRLDAGVTLKFGQKKALQHILYLGVYNLYNRRNPLYIQLREQLAVSAGELRIRREFRQAFLFPVLPSLSYTIRI